MAEGTPDGGSCQQFRWGIFKRPRARTGSSEAGDQDRDACCHSKDCGNDAASGEANVQERHQAARCQPDLEKDAPYMPTGLFAAVRDEEQDAGHDAEYGEDDAAEMDQSREDQPNAKKEVRPGLHKEVPWGK